MKEKYLYIVSQKSRLKGNFVQHLKSIIKASPKTCLAGLILREKEITKEEYTDIVEKISPLCKDLSLELYLNTDISLAYGLAKKHACHIHTSFENYLFLLEKNLPLEDLKLGISIHSIDEAKIIIENNKSNKTKVSNLLVGHIFESDCKKNLQPLVLDFLDSVIKIINNSHINLIGIGGINQEIAKSLLTERDICLAIMSLAMAEEFDEIEAKTFLTSF